MGQGEDDQRRSRVLTTPSSGHHRSRSRTRRHGVRSPRSSNRGNSRARGRDSEPRLHRQRGSTRRPCSRNSQRGRERASRRRSRSKGDGRLRIRSRSRHRSRSRSNKHRSRSQGRHNERCQSRATTTRASLRGETHQHGATCESSNNNSRSAICSVGSNVTISQLVEALRTIGDKGSHEKLSNQNTVPEFDPACKEQTIAMWIHKVNECAVIYNWTDRQTVHFALPKLKGLAQKWYAGLSTVMFSWPEWQEKLKLARTHDDARQTGQV